MILKTPGGIFNANWDILEVNRILANNYKLYPQVQSAYAIACIILAHPDNQKLLSKENFTFTLLIDLLYSQSREVDSDLEELIINQ